MWDTRIIIVAVYNVGKRWKITLNFCVPNYPQGPCAGYYFVFTDNNERIYYNFCLNIIICRYLTHYFVVLYYSWCSHWLRTWKTSEECVFFYLNRCQWRDYIYTPISLIKIRKNLSNHFVHFLGFYSSNNFPFFINEFETFYKDFGVRCEILMIKFESPKSLNLIILVYIYI